MANQSALNINSTYLRLKPNGMADKLPAGPEFWPNLIAGKLGDFHNEYLVVISSFDQNWPTWERHPNGDEMIFLMSGAVDFILETEQGEQVVEADAVAGAPLRQLYPYLALPIRRRLPDGVLVVVVDDVDVPLRIAGGTFDAGGKDHLRRERRGRE